MTPDQVAALAEHVADQAQAHRNGRTRIINRGSGHSYELDGEKVPGVTTILNNGVPKPALIGWTARTIAEYVLDRLALEGDTVTADELVADLRAYNDTRTRPEKLGAGLSRVGLTKVLATVQYADRDEAARRGTEVHRLAQELAQGAEVTVPEPLAGHVDSYLRFLDDWQPSDALLERVVISRQWRYMGRLDLIATIDHPELGRCLLDVKTARSGVFGDNALQLAGYRYAETMLTEDGEGEEPMPAVDACGIIHVRADGYDLYPMLADEQTFRTFLYCKAVADALDRDTGRVGTSRGDALEAPRKADA
jgi:hypothetical protein